MKALLTLLLIVATLVPGESRAEMIAMRDFIKLKRGMSEGEVLYRVGAFDYESVYSDHYHAVNKKIWYYIPVSGRTNAWITEITFDRRGTVSALDRYRVRD